ncbi:hypothetical protein CK500_03235 [Halorubrum salipaludis]|uniref:Uncharacterized protein n=1 Tax=Halorubrum salipaludis TaxID=2032630 RepID=A0A2A2FIS1_9EURY|nr:MULTISPECIES: hypothetical protein [Halorubrum]PAU84542.1 hypothetical protein CK500_03235 [Halorubrum salipaludis]
MTTKTEDRLLGLAVAAILATLGGELLGSQLIITAGVVAFVLALAALFGVMSVVLAVSVARTSDLNAPDPTAIESAR